MVWIKGLFRDVQRAELVVLGSRGNRVGVVAFGAGSGHVVCEVANGHVLAESAGRGAVRVAVAVQEESKFAVLRVGDVELEHAHFQQNLRARDVELADHVLDLAEHLAVGGAQHDGIRAADDGHEHHAGTKRAGRAVGCCSVWRSLLRQELDL